MRHISLFSLFLFLFGIVGWSYGHDLQEDWHPVFSDNFNRPTIGANWRWVFGDGRQYLLNNAIHLSHSGTVYCTVPLPHEELRVEMDVLLPSQSFRGTDQIHSINLELRGGEVGSGGIDERFEVALIPVSEPGDPTADPAGTLRISLDQPYHVMLQISRGIGSVRLNDKVAFQKPVAPSQSEVNRFFVFNTRYLHGSPGKEAVLDNFKIWAGTQSAAKLPLVPNTPDQNRQATCHAGDFIDPSNPALGIQRAIDSLPPGGGVVILPKGELLMRRHLRLRSHVTLCGQGAGMTILRAVQGERAGILGLKSGQGECVVSVSPQDAEKFRVGDGVCFDGNWGHPTNLDSVNKDCVVTAVADGQITVRGIAPGSAPLHVPAWLSQPATPTPPKVLVHWFPQIYAHCAEFVELRDLTIIGGDGGWGGFESAAVTFGQVSSPRLSRVEIKKWEGDGLSLQTVGDAMVTDNTVTNVQQGYHPGTSTQRFLWSRNLGVGNRGCGLYFCYYNRNGVYHRGKLDRFDGYGWPRDIFNVLAQNTCVSNQDFAIEQGEGGGGVVFHNQFPQIRVGNGFQGAPTFDFVVAQNRTDSLRFVEGNVERNLIVGNVSRDGQRPTPITETRGGNSILGRGADLDLSRLTVGIERTTSVEAIVLPQPVLDGATFYRPDEPDAGFQVGLDQLAKGGGTLLLPAGRYGLSRPLNIPAGVTLAGRGLSTVLHPAHSDESSSMIVVSRANHVTVRDLVILGEYERRAFRSAAIVLHDVTQGELVAIDVRGWEGSAISITGGNSQVRDCRTLGCAGNGFDFVRCQISCVSNIARECAHGFVVSQSRPESIIEANISGGNRANGYQFDQSPGIAAYANNASFNDRAGMTVINTANAQLVANMLAGNNQSSTDGCGIRLSGSARECGFFYNNFQDVQMQPSQLNPLIEETSANQNVIRFNLSRMKIQGDGQDSIISENFTP